MTTEPKTDRAQVPPRPMPATVTAAISRVMEELPAIGKDSQASAQQGGYAYRGIEAITSEAQSLFAKYGVVFAPRVTSHVIKDITVGGKPWTDTVLTVAYDIYGPNHGQREIIVTTGEEPITTGPVEDFITVGPLVAIGRDNSDKGANKAMTQAFKYALLQVLCISDKNDDADGTSHVADKGESSRARPSETKRRGAPKRVEDDPNTDPRVKAIIAAFEGITDLAERAEAKQSYVDSFGLPNKTEEGDLDRALLFAQRLAGAEPTPEAVEALESDSGPVSEAQAFIDAHAGEES